MNAASMLRQVESLPALVRDEFEALDERVRRAINHHDLLSTKRIVITGCGDSYMAALASELAFEQLGQLPCEASTALKFARYGATYESKAFPRNPLVLGISAGGRTARTAEALQIARAEGALTVGLTAAPDSPLARAAEITLNTSVADFGPGPGVRTYFASLLVLYLLAIRFREVRDLISQEDANTLRRELRRSADAMAATLDSVRAPAQALAEQLKAHQALIFIGDGPNHGSALYSAAKLSEACGLHAMGQESEEWHHLQYYINVMPDMPTFFISPGGRGHGRVAELMEPARRIKRFVVAIVPLGDMAIAPHADAVLPVQGAVREAFTPLVYGLPGALFAAQLCTVLGTTPFKGFQEEYDAHKEGANNSGNSRIIGRAELAD
jgi:glutamine---fructose-6-phosphate transaminase (isomerizing)